MRIEIVHNGDRRKAVVILPMEAPSTEDVLKAACNKLRLKARQFQLYCRGVQLQQGDRSSLQDGCTVWVVGENDRYAGPSPEALGAADDARAKVSILDGSDVWIDPEAVEQVSQGDEVGVRGVHGTTIRWEGVAWPGGIACMHAWQGKCLARSYACSM